MIAAVELATFAILCSQEECELTRTWKGKIPHSDLDSGQFYLLDYYSSQ